jgi:[ribosomal protein S5]-alanine N-acetyltransferase
MEILRTARLRLRRFSEDDAEFIISLLNDPAFIRFIGDRGVRNAGDARGYLRNGPIKSYGENGFGLYLVTRSDTGAPIGMCGLIKRAGLADVDLGYAFVRPAWGRGYASEAAAAVLDYGRNALALRRIVAIVDPDNAASIRVLERIGLKPDGTVRLPDDDMDLLLYG